MLEKFSEFRCKEVINVLDGMRLGFVNDLEIETRDGRIVTIIIPGPCKFFGLFGRDSDYVIPWQCIRKIGADIILVEVVLTEARKPRIKKKPVF